MRVRFIGLALGEPLPVGATVELRHAKVVMSRGHCEAAVVYNETIRVVDVAEGELPLLEGLTSITSVSEYVNHADPSDVYKPGSLADVLRSESGMGWRCQARLTDISLLKRSRLL